MGLLVIGQDANGPHLFETSPTANHYEYIGQAIGARSQSARTYIEKVAPELADATLEKLIRFGVNALRESLQSSSSDELTAQNCTVAVVGKDTPLKIYNDDDVLQFVKKINQKFIPSLYVYMCYFLLFYFFYRSKLMLRWKTKNKKHN